MWSFKHFWFSRHNRTEQKVQQKGQSCYYSKHLLSSLLLRVLFTVAWVWCWSVSYLGKCCSSVRVPLLFTPLHGPGKLSKSYFKEHNFENSQLLNIEVKISPWRRFFFGYMITRENRFEKATRLRIKRLYSKVNSEIPVTLKSKSD